MSKATAIIFLGDPGSSPVTELVTACQRAVAHDTIERLHQSEAFEKVILVTAGQSADPCVVLEPSGSPFHFGRRLRDVIRKYNIQTPFYIGGGSGALLSPDDLKELAGRISNASNTVMSNNPYSADLVAFTPGSAIESIEPPAADNPLAQLLAGQAGLRQVPLPQSARYQFDVDTPTDLSILRLHPDAGRNAKAYLESLELDTSRLERAARLLTDVNAQVVVAGRVGSYVWSQLERGTACRVRMLAEERSMHTDERAGRGEVCTILGFYLEQVGNERFFQALSRMGHAAFIDTRVLFTHLGLDLSTDDRFHSDLGRYQDIVDPVARDLTRAAMEAPIPVILGGHSLVCGGMLALIEIARQHG